MTNIYLVIACNCNGKGIMLPKTKEVHLVYTNKKLAYKAVYYLNDAWRNALDTGNFKNIKWYAVETRRISHVDFSKLSY